MLPLFDDLLRNCVSHITNTALKDSHWAQACLPIKSGGLGITHAVDLAPSAFLSATTRVLQSLVFKDNFMHDSDFESIALSCWSGLSGCPALVGALGISRQTGINLSYKLSYLSY